MEFEVSLNANVRQGKRIDCRIIFAQPPGRIPMKTKTAFALAGLLGVVGLTPAEDSTPAPAPTTDRVEFPKDYATTYAVLRTVVREEGTKVVTVYGNAAAASVTNKTQLPYPYGSVIVMETAATRKDADGKPVKDADGKLQKDKVLGMHVMRKEKGFGEAYQTNRSGEWEYVEYRADGSYLTPPAKSASCSECHVKAGKEKDFVYRGRFGE